jgi:hypothetical protein
MRVRGGFADEIAGVQLSDGGVDVIRIEHNACHDLVFGVDFKDAQRLGRF